MLFPTKFCPCFSDCYRLTMMLRGNLNGLQPFQTYSDRPQLNRFSFLVSVLEHLIAVVVEKSQLFLHGRGFWSSQFHEDPKILAQRTCPPASSTLIQAPHIPRQMAYGHRNARQRSRWPQRAKGTNTRMLQNGCHDVNLVIFVKWGYNLCPSPFHSKPTCWNHFKL